MFRLFSSQSNHSVILYNNAMISFNMIEAARLNDVKRFYYASSACIYPEGRQLDTKNPGLKEADAWPAQPQDAYGLEKLASEELAIHYGKDFGMETRVGRFQYVLLLVLRGGCAAVVHAHCAAVIARCWCSFFSYANPRLCC